MIPASAAPRPPSEIPGEALRGVFSDLDDTISSHGRVPEVAYRALFQARKAGLRVVLATGRPGGYAEVLAALWPVDAVVAENGGYAVLADGSRRYWDPEAARTEQAARLRALVADVQAKLSFAHLADDRELRRVDVAFDVNERQHLDAGQLAALVALMESHGARVLVSSIHAHAAYGDFDKAKMLARTAAELWDETEDAVRSGYLFVGDSPNDQAGFAFFTHAAGVANVLRYSEVLDPPPRYVASLTGGEGFAEIVEALISRRR